MMDIDSMQVAIAGLAMFFSGFAAAAGIGVLMLSRAMRDTDVLDMIGMD